MKKTCKKFLSVLLAFALVFTASALGFGSIQTTSVLETIAAKTGSTVTTAASIEQASAILLNEGAVQADDETGVHKDGVITACGGNCDYAPSIIIHGIGQSELYELDKDGNRKIGEDGKPITAWPPTVDMDYITGALAYPLVATLLTQED